MYFDYNRLRKWEIAGAFFIIIFGCLLHFVYDWSNKSTIVAMFGTVNESLWEHLKLGYWALAFFMLLEYWYVRKYTDSFFIAKALGIFAMSLFIIFGFYLYTAIMDKHSLIMDIILFIIGAVLCQFISLKIMKVNLSNRLNKVGFIAFILMGAILILFTFRTPHLSIFKDESKGIYGIE